MSTDTSKPPAKEPATDSLTEGFDIDARLRLFDAATARQRARKPSRKTPADGTRDWTREELYERGSSDAD